MYFFLLSFLLICIRYTVQYACRFPLFSVQLQPITLPSKFFFYFHFFRVAARCARLLAYANKFRTACIPFVDHPIT